jgi:hypothetical protein
VDAFDADVLIYAAVPGHPLGRKVAALFAEAPPGESGKLAGIGSVLLIPEVLAKPLRDGETDAVKALSAFLARLDLRPVDRATALLATVLGARCKLRRGRRPPRDGGHHGGRRFITSNERDFGLSIKEVDITFPADLPEAG